MSRLCRDILYLIFEELHKDDSTLHSCLLVNKTWCKIIVPFLWINPWKYLNYRNRKYLLELIILHLSDKSRNKLENQGIDFTLNSYKKPLFNYIYFCRHLNLDTITELVRDYKMWIIYDEIICLFINENTKFTHLYLSQKFDYPIHFIPGAEHCISEIKFLSCNTNINDNILTGLIKLCKSIKELELITSENNNNYGIARLIETQESLFNVRYLIEDSIKNDTSFRKVLEESLIKHANTMQHFKITKQPITQILSYFINLKSLKLNGDFFNGFWEVPRNNCSGNLSSPFLQILEVSNVDFEFLINTIKSTSGYLTEIAIDRISYDNRNIQAIYAKCPNLKYLKIKLTLDNILEFENLLINCQYLDGLFIVGKYSYYWYSLCEILARSSPNSLFKFKFKSSIDCFEHEYLKLFLDNWKKRCPSHPMEIQLMTQTYQSICKKFNRKV
jgi:hypothetical protein